MSFGFGHRLPNSRALPPAGGGGATTFDPATLTYNAGVDAMWWHYTQATMNTVYDGSGSVPAVTDPVGRITSQNTSPTRYTWNNTQQTGAYRPVLAADGVLFPGGATSYFYNNMPQYTNLGTENSSAPHGLTFAFRVHVSAEISTGEAYFALRDTNDSDFRLTPGNVFKVLDAAYYGLSHTDTGFDGAWHNIAFVVGSGSDSAYGIRLFIDDPNTHVAINDSYGSQLFTFWRDFVTNSSTNADIKYQGEFKAFQKFTGADLANIFAFLENGA